MIKKTTYTLVMGTVLGALSPLAQATTVLGEAPTPIPCEGMTPQTLLSQGYVEIQKEDGKGAKEVDAGFVALTKDTLLPFIMGAGPGNTPVYEHVDTKKHYTDLCVWKRVNDNSTSQTPDNDIVFFTYFGKPIN